MHGAREMLVSPSGERVSLRHIGEWALDLDRRTFVQAIWDEILFIVKLN